VRVGHPSRRCLVLLLAVALAFGAVVVRLVDLQVVKPGTYAAAGMAQRLRTVQLPAERGSIFDRNGAELAMSVRQKTVWADPRAVQDPAATATALASVLDVDRAKLQAKLRGPGAFVYIARQVDLDTAAAVEKLQLPGVNLVDESKRFDPAGALAGSVLGGVDVDGTGISGLEKQFNDKLVGVPGRLEIEKGPDGRTIAGGRQHVTSAQRGSDLVLTIDRSLQFEVERALSDAMARWNAKHATAIVMDPTSGEILAMANLGRDAAGNPAPTGENRAITVTFEPGSVNKVITVAGALEEGVVSPNTVLNVPDHLQVSTHRFSDHDPHAPMNWSVTDIITQSSNVGSIKIAQQLGVPKVQDYLRRFGLGQYTGIGLPNETRGIMKFGRWYGTDIGSIPIGQGLGVNALQMLQVFNVFASGGMWVEPHLVKEVVGPDGTESTAPPPKTHRVVSEHTAKQMTAMLANVVKVGTGVNAAIDGYTVAGKTGTPRKVIDQNYQIGAYVPSFAGYVPAESPRLSAIVVLDEPRPIYYAGQVSAPVFARIQQYALRLFRIPPPSHDLGVNVPTPQPTDVNQRD
jgi:cell division protein FtsI (penicillin-binding protein 3)